MLIAEARFVRPAPGCVEVRRGQVAVRLAGATRYDPAGEPGLHRDLLDVDGEEAAAIFAERYGPLFRHQQEEGLFSVSEPLAAWGSRIKWLRHVLHVWAVAKGWPDADARKVARIDDADGGAGSVKVLDHAGEWVEALRVKGDRDFLRCVPTAARLWAGRVLSAEASAHGGPVLDCDDVPGQGWRFRPSSLWGVAVWLAGVEVAGLATFRRCASCGRWLKESKSMGPDAGVTTCSGTCRQALHRQRKNVKVTIKQAVIEVDTKAG